jgi:uncharacterized paraquat-inducible protein A
MSFLTAVLISFPPSVYFQLVSQISSHFIIHYHRSVVNDAAGSLQHRHQLAAAAGLHGMLASPKLQEEAESCSCPKEQLSTHQFSRLHRGESAKVHVRSWVRYWVVFLGLSVTVLIIVGCTLPSISLEILGIIGVAVESGQAFEDATTHHSVFTIVELLMEEAHFLDTAGAYIGLGVLCLLFVCTVLIVPVMQSMSLLSLWFVPMTTRQRTRASIVNEILQAWQYVEVYLIAVLVASWYVYRRSSCKKIDLKLIHIDAHILLFFAAVYKGNLDPYLSLCLIHIVVPLMAFLLRWYIPA